MLRHACYSPRAALPGPRARRGACHQHLDLLRRGISAGAFGALPR